MPKKKLMLLGGLRYLLPVIKKAHELGYHVITCDYLPHNIAHKYADEYINESIIDKEAILKVAQDRRIDGIMSFAVDPGVVTAAYVAEHMGLPFQGSFESVSILQNKARFRQFLTENGFNVPKAKGYNFLSEVQEDVEYFHWPVIVKPVDSAGSKGVSKADKPDGLAQAVAYALRESHNGHFIVEEFLEKSGNSSDTDCFTINGKLTFCTFSDQRFDAKAANPYTPSAYSWPSTMPDWAQTELRKELQRLMTLLNMKTGIYNVETRLCTDGKPYIMEVSPRGGGNRLAEMLHHVTHTDLVGCAVKAAMGEPISELSLPRYYGQLAEMILHADRTGIFDHVAIADSMKPHIVETDLWVSPNDKVLCFDGANHAIGTLVARFDTQEELEHAMSNAVNWCKVVVK